MKRNLGAIPAVYPMPVLIIAAYGEDGKIELMNAAWGTACEMDKLALFISKGHKTTQSILKTGAFSVSIADREHMAAADYVGIATGNKTPDKFARTGLTASKSAFVNAPVFEEFPVVMECTLDRTIDEDGMFCVIGKIVNAAAEERTLGEDGNVDPEKLDAILFDTFRRGYHVIGTRVGKAWNAGKPLIGD